MIITALINLFAVGLHFGIWQGNVNAGIGLVILALAVALYLEDRK